MYQTMTATAEQSTNKFQQFIYSKKLLNSLDWLNVGSSSPCCHSRYGRLLENVSLCKTQILMVHKVGVASDVLGENIYTLQ